MSRENRKIRKIGNTKIVPISIKILWVFVSLLLFSNFSSNLISIMLSQRQINQLTNEILADHLKQIFMSATNQYELYKYSNDKDTAVNAIKKVAQADLSSPGNIALAMNTDGEILFIVNGRNYDRQKMLEKLKFKPLVDFAEKNRVDADAVQEWGVFPDSNALNEINKRLVIGTNEGVLHFTSESGDYQGVYTYQKDWNLYFVCAEGHSEILYSSLFNFGIISIFILVVTVIFLCVGLFLLNKILKNIGIFATDLYEMQSQNRLGTIDISKSNHDDVTYFAASFNALSSSVNNLLTTFQKFVPKDITAKAYAGQSVNLEGNQKELTIMFSDIRNFTSKTEVLGNEIIDLLNIHYSRIIHLIHENEGVIGSIIGDAILGIYGTEESKNKSLNAVQAAYQMIRTTYELREAVKQKKVQIEEKRKLTDAEDKVYRACLIEIGVGLDGGTVFYGNIGSLEHMANTVIGDNVNSASRLEGLTRLYALPVICSKYVKDEVEKTSSQYRFEEIDMVQVKGKSEGNKIYYPVDLEIEPQDVVKEFDVYHEALQHYYEGDWSSARKKFKEFKKFMQKNQPSYVTMADVFIHRMGLKSAPANWSGIWAMTTK